jgi:hypothetical protein
MLYVKNTYAMFARYSIAITLLLSASTVPSVGADTDHWHRKNLYDAAARAYYIPYQLWTGARWDGGRQPEPHDVDIRFMKEKSIEGPIRWNHPYLKREFSVYRRLNRGKEQLFAFYPNGIGRVYDNRERRYYDADIKFPAGPGWKVGVPVDFKQRFWRDGESRDNIRTVTIEITDLRFDRDEVLEEMTYRYSVNGRLDHEYSYRPNLGMVRLKEY